MSTEKSVSSDIPDSIITSMMQDTMETYLNPEEPFLNTPRDKEEDTIVPTITEVQEKYNQLYERYISLKAMAESLKDQISSEKEQWNKELKATLKIEAQMKQGSRHECGDRITLLNEEEYKKKVDLFKDFIFFQHATENLESIMRKKNYQSWLSEVENKCNLELMKIKDSMMMLKPLKDIASRWSNKAVGQERKCICGASGDEVENIPVRDTKELEIDES